MANSKRVNFLFELLCEELPADSIDTLVDTCRGYLANALLVSGFTSGEKEFKRYLNKNVFNRKIITYATPRRIAFLIKNLAIKEDLEADVVFGPKVDLGNKAKEGFANNFKVDVNTLSKKKHPNSNALHWFFEPKPKHISEVLPDILKKMFDDVILKNKYGDIKLKKTMRWGDTDYVFMRPVHGIVALLDEEILPVSLFGIKSGRTTCGLRTVNKKITIDSAVHYEDCLFKNDILVDVEKRKKAIIEQITTIEKKTGFTWKEDDALLNEVCHLVEVPKAILCRFDEQFLSLPKEIIDLTIKLHQKYFLLVNEQQQLQSDFIVIANTITENTKDIKLGNERVIRARLTDVEFFLNEDLKIGNQERLEQLKSVVFIDDLGSLYDKTERLRKVVKELATLLKINEEDKNTLDKATLLAKTDLVSNVVIELPKLQGFMGSYYAQMESEKKAVVDIIRQQYMPRFSDDILPDSLLAAILAISDKLDTIVGLFSIGKIPTANKDPFALRRLAIGVIRIIIKHNINVNMHLFVKFIVEIYTKDTQEIKQILALILDFIFERAREYYLGKNVSFGIVDAVFALKRTDYGYRIADINERITLIKSLDKDTLERLKNINRRIVNILREHEPPPNTSLGQVVTDFNLDVVSETDSEKQLHKEVGRIQEKSYTEHKTYIKDLCGLEKYIDDFFNNNRIDVEDEWLQKQRLELLTAIRILFLKIADWAKL